MKSRLINNILGYLFLIIGISLSFDYMYYKGTCFGTGFGLFVSNLIRYHIVKD